MHDGSIATLEQVIDAYSDGGRVIESGPNRGDGRTESVQERVDCQDRPQLAGKQDLLAFLKSLTDESLLKDPRFSDPWKHKH